MNKKYSIEQEEFIKNQSPLITDTQLALKFNVAFGTNIAINSIAQKRRRLNIAKARGRKVKGKTEGLVANGVQGQNMYVGLTLEDINRIPEVTESIYINEGKKWEGPANAGSDGTIKVTN